MEDNDNDQGKRPGVPLRARNRASSNMIRISIRLVRIRVGAVGSSSGNAGANASVMSTSIVMVGFSTSTVKPNISMARLSAVKINTGMAEVSVGMVRPWVRAMEASATIVETNSGMAGTSANIAQLTDQFQQMTITPHLVRPVMFLLNVVQLNYLERVGLVNKCFTDLLGVIDASLARVNNNLFNLYFNFLSASSA